MAWEMLGLVLRIIPVSDEIYQTGRDYNSPDRGQKLVDLIVCFLSMRSARKFARRVIVTLLNSRISLGNHFSIGRNSSNRT